MDAATISTDIRLREGSSIAQRLVMSAFAAAVALCFTPGLFTRDPLEIIISVVALLVGAGFVGGIMLAPHGGVDHHAERDPDRATKSVRKAPHAGRRKRRHQRIAGSRRQAGESPLSTRLHARFGERLTSPPIADVTHVRDTVARIAAQFEVPNVEEPVNPLDASNPEMHLGEPLEAFSARDIRIVSLIAVALSAVPYAYKLWRGWPPTHVDILLLPLGVIAAFAVHRYANLVTGAFWIIRESDIRVERLWGDGTPRADHIEGHEVKTITVERRGRSEDEHCIVTIRLRSGQRFRSPASGRGQRPAPWGPKSSMRLGISPESNKI